MKATTIKLQGELLEKLEASKPPDQSLTFYVRSVLQESLDRLKIKEAALEYRTFVESDKIEKACLDEWDRADLNTVPTEKKASL